MYIYVIRSAVLDWKSVWISVAEVFTFVCKEDNDTLEFM